jgi:hypothetical protein
MHYNYVINLKEKRIFLPYVLCFFFILNEIKSYRLFKGRSNLGTKMDMISSYAIYILDSHFASIVSPELSAKIF